MNKIHIGIVAVALMLGLSVVGQAQTLSVTNGLTLQLKADGSLFQDSGGSTPVTDGSAVGLWQDAAGNVSSANASQATGSLQPTFHNGVLNGKPVVRFDGANDELNIFAGATLLGSAYTTFAVFNLSSIPITGVNGYDNPAIWMNPSGDEGMSFKNPLGTPMVMSYSYPGTPAQSINTGQFTLAVAKLSGGVASIQSAGAGSGNEGTVTSAPGGGVVGGASLLIGMNYQHNYGFNGDIAEVLIYDRALTTLEITAVNTYLDNKYALGLGLTSVPEPSTVALVCGAGFLFLGLRRRRV